MDWTRFSEGRRSGSDPGPAETAREDEPVRIRRMIAEQGGASLVEYTLLASLIAIASLGALEGLGDSVQPLVELLAVVTAL